MKIKLLSNNAIIPTRANPTDAGLDLYTVEGKCLMPMERYAFATDIAMAIPEGYYGLIGDRSGKALSHGLHVLGGRVDSAYRGNIKVILVNLSNSPVIINVHDKIAQMTIEKVLIESLEVVDSLEQTDRGEKGFGSSGQ